MRRWALRLLLVAWALATVVLAGGTMVLHDLPLPLGQPHREAAGAWRVTHVLSAKCACSQRVAQTLVERGAAADAEERVALVDDQRALGVQLEQAGFKVIEVAAGELRESLGVESVPMLIIHRPDGSIGYHGAYAPRRTMPAEDVALLTAVREGKSPQPYALFGCAVSTELKHQMDPLGLE